MSWTEIAQGQVGELPLRLYAKNGGFMLRVDGYELMNSFCHHSEKELAKLAAAEVCASFPRVLIGGLGLGFTLKAFLEQFSARADISVVEKSTDVLHWYRCHFRKLLKIMDHDSQVHFINDDVSRVLGESSPVYYDLIVLDVDNGPEAISVPENAGLYNREGLVQIYSRLNPGGAFLLWSGFEDAEFLLSAKQAGFAARCEAIDLADGRNQHFAFICRRPTSRPTWPR